LRATLPSPCDSKYRSQRRGLLNLPHATTSKPKAQRCPREELAALLDRRGRISAARSGRAGKRLVISLAPLSMAEAADFLASVPGSRVRPSGSTGRVEVDVKGAAALTFVESVVDLVGDGLRARLSIVLDILDAACAASIGNAEAHV
jgi:hypothetical protein